MFIKTGDELPILTIIKSADIDNDETELTLKKTIKDIKKMEEVKEEMKSEK